MRFWIVPDAPFLPSKPWIARHSLQLEPPTGGERICEICASRRLCGDPGIVENRNCPGDGTLASANRGPHVACLFSVPPDHSGAPRPLFRHAKSSPLDRFAAMRAPRPGIRRPMHGLCIFNGICAPAAVHSSPAPLLGGTPHCPTKSPDEERLSRRAARSRTFAVVQGTSWCIPAAVLYWCKPQAQFRRRKSRSSSRRGPWRGKIAIFQEVQIRMNSQLLHCYKGPTRGSCPQRRRAEPTASLPRRCQSASRVGASGNAPHSTDSALITTHHRRKKSIRPGEGSQRDRRAASPSGVSLAF